ncbi:Imm1 family immunity protein [Actinokineospora sp. G85]|uniref:Imm1 family immunity protein n=1 Tax=Actinokineospora sp. G85 TaxID=3406626 RepID=UPI003C74013C
MITEVYYRTPQNDTASEQVQRLRSGDLDRLMHILDTEAPFGASLHTVTADLPDTAPAQELVVGIHDGLGALYYNDDHGSWYSTGPTPPETDGPVYADIDFPPRCEVPRAELTAALGEFLAHGSRPTCITWQEDPHTDF